MCNVVPNMAEGLVFFKNKTEKNITMDFMVVGKTYGSSVNSSLIVLYALHQDHDRSQQGRSKYLTKPSDW